MKLLENCFMRSKRIKVSVASVLRSVDNILSKSVIHRKFFTEKRSKQERHGAKKERKMSDDLNRKHAIFIKKRFSVDEEKKIK